MGLICIKTVLDWQCKLLFERRRDPEPKPDRNQNCQHIHILFIDLFTQLVNVETMIHI